MFTVETFMHFDFLPKVTHNEDVIREYERGEGKKIVRWVKRLIVVIPVILLIILLARS